MKWNEQLRQERKSRGWAQGWVAKEIGTTTDTVNRWENGKTFPSPFYRQQLSQLFEKSLEELGLFNSFSEFESIKSNIAKIPELSGENSKLTSDEEHVYNNYNTRKALLTVIGEADGDLLLFAESESKSREQSGLASEEEHMHNNQDASKDAKLLERGEPGRYTLHQVVIDDESPQGQASPAQQGPASSPVSDVQAHEPNTETLEDPQLLDQPLWELRIQMRGLPAFRPFHRFSSRSVLFLSTILLTILIIVALLSVFNRLLLPTSPPPSTPQESIDDIIHGTGTNQFNYIGNGWAHRTSSQDTMCGYTSILNNSTISSDNTANDYVTITFTGIQLEFYGMVAPSFGIGAVSIDGSREKMIDFYAATLESNQLLWTSPKLSAGTHTFKLRVTGNQNPRSFSTYVAVDRVNIIHYVLQ